MALGIGCTVQELLLSVLGILGVDMSFLENNALMRWVNNALDARNGGAELVFRTLGEG